MGNPPGCTSETPYCVQPSRIGRDSLATYTLLADGTPRISFTSSLIDVKVSRGINGSWEDRVEDWVDKIPFPLQGLIVIVVGGMILFGISLLLGDAGLIKFQFEIDKD
ncbi:hypothetical protein [Streptomyces sporangiiformans]|uniref:Uncharacterized protein n=1 Tax=Streptomyces sporangiiformans TaxID=2315329 RepID=A0A505D7H2_9ACTN|nr:hypothetical protein [Streptomyces sporangiiformans]TPQ16658.1 hypothetical protein FGD71_040525 [Streptomyces sporangiiformans]